MLSQLMDYGAVSAKVRALWGKRLTPEDYRRLASSRTVPEIAMILHAHPGWSGAFADILYTDIHRGELEAALRHFSLKKYLSLFAFLPRGDHELLRYPVITTELNEIMRFMALASTGRSQDYICSLPSFFMRYSDIKYMALDAAATYDDLLGAVRETDFHSILQRIRPEHGGFPQYSLVETAMLGYFFNAVGAIIERRSGASTKDKLHEAFGIQADLINISNIMRVKRFYPEMEKSIFSLLLPMSAKLTPGMLKNLYSAPDEQSAFELLNGSFYAKYLRGQSYGYIEEYYYAILYEYNRLQFYRDTSSVFVPLAYVHLQGVELNNLVHIIECVRYGIPPHDIQQYLVGVAL